MQGVPKRQCISCSGKAVLKRPRTGKLLCKACFFESFEQEVHDTIVKHGLFKRGDVVALGASGGKDSTVLASVLNVLNKKHDYGLKLLLLSIDEGIVGYRDDSLETVKRNCEQSDFFFRFFLCVLDFFFLQIWIAADDPVVQGAVRMVDGRDRCPDWTAQ
jgi:hypothetical protein